ncbi:t-SNARE [Komagataella phaffii CBS 7435]|uniref:t-SNARE affecting a late Golgi compartment protein 1 n=2 Tax=Komagataella phaffii TaxID=460519 RepID=C4R3E1_KOMPG|nr:Essential t-SNARE that forms a complex with Tlg2p and Vti1p and mediates fusion of endosome-derived [Komagataella phaffii GS115]AOA63525.1 GQ67_03061T0 [Komagataella phaffii]CAH2450305.1 t-SNARE [Komagataella phaffii CBS 7435]AOA69020.1 GQ68_03045T0 [Komagataella phaffii GS115]CAY69976.1 Essential t-SNARE that forms a complex with Tlg2p and Vti1p and mediates fusion of endosome-derived [Komagataella phaffii GS115]CCA40135.2 t-SNARE [Komagataella phaffii CBS 7435]
MDPFNDVYKDAVSQVNQLDGIINNLTPKNINQSNIDDIENNKQELNETIQDLRDTVRIIRENNDNYNISEKELDERIAKVDKISATFQQLNLHWNDKLAKRPKEVTTMANRISQDYGNENPFNNDTAFQEFQQQEVLREQDQHLDSVYNTMQNIHLQASTMGTELEDQGILLDDLDTDFDRVGGKLTSGVKRIEWFIEKNKERASDCCIILLIIALIFLLVLLFIA